jgi:hypothetical protein
MVISYFLNLNFGAFTWVQVNDMIIKKTRVCFYTHAMITERCQQKTCVELYSDDSNGKRIKLVLRDISQVIYPIRKLFSTLYLLALRI